MNKALPYILTMVALLVGIGIGTLGSGWYYRSKVQKMSKMMGMPAGLKSFHYDLLDLTDKQKTQLDPIFEYHGKRIFDHRFKLMDQVDSLRSAIKPILTAEQMERLNMHSKRMRRVMPPPPNRMRQRREREKERRHGRANDSLR